MKNCSERWQRTKLLTDAIQVVIADIAKFSEATLWKLFSERTPDYSGEVRLSQR